MTTISIEQMFNEDIVEPFVDIQEIVEATGMTYDERLSKFLIFHDKCKTF